MDRDCADGCGGDGDGEEEEDMAEEMLIILVIMVAMAVSWELKPGRWFVVKKKRMGFILILLFLNVLIRRKCQHLDSWR